MGNSSRLSGELFDGRAEGYAMQGSAPSFSGLTGSLDSIHIHVEPDHATPLGLVPVNLKGKWHLDTLMLQPELPYWTGNSLRTSSNDPDQSQPITMIMKKGEVDAFRSACGL